MKMNKIKFLKNYFNDLAQLIKFNDDTIIKLLKVRDLLLNVKKK